MFFELLKLRGGVFTNIYNSMMLWVLSRDNRDFDKLKILSDRFRFGNSSEIGLSLCFNCGRPVDSRRSSRALPVFSVGAEMNRGRFAYWSSISRSIICSNRFCWLWYNKSYPDSMINSSSSLMMIICQSYRSFLTIAESDGNYSTDRMRAGRRRIHIQPFWRTASPRRSGQRPIFPRKKKSQTLQRIVVRTGSSF